MTDWRILFAQYLADPDEYWRGQRARSVGKVRRAVNFHTASEIVSLSELADAIIERVRCRGSEPLTTLFVPNSGGAGSHWLATLLCDAAPFCGGEEVYLAPRMVDLLRTTSPTHRSLFLDALHLLHSPLPLDRSAGLTFINSAHNFVLPDIYHREARTVLLVRDPVATVMSRTFRKMEFRRTVARAASDQAYALHNARIVSRFYELAGAAGVDHFVRYEDLRQDGVRELNLLLNVVGVQVSEESVANSVQALSPGGGSVARTSYSGVLSQSAPDWLREMVQAEVGPYVSKFGY